MTDITAGRVAGSAAAGRAEYPIKRIIFASGLGTMIEWYDLGVVRHRIPRAPVRSARLRADR